MKETLLLLFFVLPQVGSAGEPLQLAQITIDEAAKKVIQGKKQRVLGAKTEQVDGKKIHVIKSLSPDGRIQHHRFDAQSGKRLGRSGKK